MGNYRKYIVRYVDFDENTATHIGEKASILFKLDKIYKKIPQFICVTPAAFYDSLTPKLLELMEQSKIEYFSNLFLQEFQLKQTIIDEIRRYSAEIGRIFAVRRSPISAAGRRLQLSHPENFLCIPIEKITDFVKKIWFEELSQTVEINRKNSEHSGKYEPSAIIIQKIVNPDISGRAFSYDLTDGDLSKQVIVAVRNFSTTITNNSSDIYRIDADYNITYKLGEQKIQHTMVNNMFAARQLPEHLIGIQCVDNDVIIRIADLVKNISRTLGSLHEIDWAYENGEIYLIQCKKMTGFSRVIQKKAKSFLFDSREFQGNYSEQVLPLTYSYVERINMLYRYRQMEVFGASCREISTARISFGSLIGYFDGKIYANVRSNSVLKTILPAGKTARSKTDFMIDNSLENNLEDSFESDYYMSEKLSDYFRRFILLFRKIIAETKFEKNVIKYEQDFFKLFDNTNIYVKSLDKMCEIYREYEDKMRFHLKTQIFCDYLLKELFHIAENKLKKIEISRETLVDSLCGNKSTATLKRSAALDQIVSLIHREPRLSNLLIEGNIDSIEKQLSLQNELMDNIQEFWNEFSCCSENNLLFEEGILGWNKLDFYRIIGSISLLDGDIVKIVRAEKSFDLKTKIEKKTVTRFSVGMLQKRLTKLFEWSERIGQTNVKTFIRLKQLFFEIGFRFVSLGVLETKNDVLYLTIDEILNFVEGGATLSNLKLLVRIRKAESDYNNSKDKLLPVFMTNSSANGVVKYAPPGNEDWTSEYVEQDGEVRYAVQGIGTCSGIVTGIAKVWKIGDGGGISAKINSGEILVTKKMDVFSEMAIDLFAAVIIENEDFFSHSAAFLRENNVCAVLKAEKATELIKNGDKIRINSGTGLIEILN